MAADSQSFIELLLQGFEDNCSDFDDILKFLETNFKSLDLNQFGELLFEILVTGKVKGNSSKCWKGSLFENEGNYTEVKAITCLVGKLLSKLPFLESHLVNFFRNPSNVCGEKRRPFAKALASFLQEGVFMPKNILNILGEYKGLCGKKIDFILDVLVFYKGYTCTESLVFFLKSTGLAIELSRILLSPHCEFFETEICLRGVSEIAEVLRTEMAKKNRLTIRNMLKKKVMLDEIIKVTSEMMDSGKLTTESSLEEVWRYVCPTDKFYDVEKVIEELHYHGSFLKQLARTAHDQLHLVDIIFSSLSKDDPDVGLFVSVVLFLLKDKVVPENVLREWKISYPRVNPSSDILYKRLTDVIDYIDSGQNGEHPIEVAFACDVPLHGYLRDSNILCSLALLKTIAPSTTEKDVKRKLVDSSSWDRQISAPATKRASKNSSYIFSRVDSFVLQHLSGEPSNGNIQELLGGSSKNFCLMLSFMTTLVIETDFNPRIIRLFRDLVRDIHQQSEFPSDLYPSDLKKLITLTSLPEHHKELITHVISQEFLLLLSTNSFLAKIFLLLFPDEVNLTLNSIASTPSIPPIITVFQKLM